MSKRISKTKYSKISNDKLLELSLLTERLRLMYSEEGIDVPALSHHLKGMDFEIKTRIIAFKNKEASKNVKN